jgi:hypothetical protein
MRFGVSVTKSTSFRLGVQQFSNTYYFEGPVTEASTTELQALADAVVALERAQHGPNITFVRVRVWSQIGTPSQNNMLIDQDLSGVGTASAAGTYDKERAFLVRFRAGVDSRGRPVYLRKWWHLDVSTVGGTAISANALQQTAALTSGQRAALETFANSFKSINISPGNPWELVAKSGRSISGSTQAHQFLEHHQLGDEWRGQ